MPLRDHFRSPLDDQQSWESFHASWPVMIVANLRRKLPRGYRLCRGLIRGPVPRSTWQPSRMKASVC